MNKKLYRDEYHKVLGGVCAGLAEYFEMDVTVLRLLFAFTVIIMGVGVIPYIVLWIVLPKRGYPYNVYNNANVDYVVPSQQPGEQYTHQSNPFSSGNFANSQQNANPFITAPKQKSNAGIIIGLVLIILGAAILIDEFDLIPDFDFERLWPAILVIVGGALIVSGQNKSYLHKQNRQNNTVNDNLVTDVTEPIDNNTSL